MATLATATSLLQLLIHKPITASHTTEPQQVSILLVFSVNWSWDKLSQRQNVAGPETANYTQWLTLNSSEELTLNS